MIDITHILQFVKGKKILLQLSGGKDSIACMILLKELGVELEAIHFIHAYNYPLPTEIAIKACKKFNVRLHIKDVTGDLSTLLMNNNFSGRPCRHCKSIMDYFTVKFAKASGCQIICIGDTGDDTMLINRLLEIESSSQVLSRYINKNVNLPADTFIVRPLLKIHGKEILEFVKSRFADFKRVHDTGDKYFEYSREGCPLQFKDMGAEYTEDMMKKLKLYNSLCSEFAMSRNIRASIHLPSEFIVTIPKGYEDECRKYLIDKGCKINSKQINQFDNFVTTVNVRANGITLSPNVIYESFIRYIERLGLKSRYVNDNQSIVRITGDNFDAVCFFSTQQIISISIISSFSLNHETLGNLCVEIFHTCNFSVSSTKI